MDETIDVWKTSLRRLLEFYEARRGPLVVFFPLLFVFFVFVNIVFYWWAMITAFPFLISAWQKIPVLSKSAATILNQPMEL